MQVIATSPGNVVIHTFEDGVEITIGANSTIVAPPVDMEILDVNDSNAVLYSGVTPPDDWELHKTGPQYLYDGNSWSANPDPMVWHPDPRNWNTFSLVDGEWLENDKYLLKESGEY